MSNESKQSSPIGDVDVEKYATQIKMLLWNNGATAGVLQEMTDAIVSYHTFHGYFPSNQAGSQWASPRPNEGWISVKDKVPELIEGQDYSENVLAILDGKLRVMGYCWIDCGQEGKGYVWANCYGNIDGDAEFDDEYHPTHWMPLPKLLPRKRDDETPAHPTAVTKVKPDEFGQTNYQWDGFDSLVQAGKEYPLPKAAAPKADDALAETRDALSEMIRSMSRTKNTGDWLDLDSERLENAKKILAKYAEPHTEKIVRSAAAPKADVKSKEEILNEFLQEPYPEDIFPPLSSEQLQAIHKLLLREMNIPIDRLSAQIGRVLRKPLVEYANQFKG